MAVTYYSLNQYVRDNFGHKLYKVAIDGGFTCPNRDGSVGVSGCIFCSGRGSGDFTPGGGLTISEQIEEGAKKISKKLGCVEQPAYIAYFQAFTNTYSDIEDLKNKYTEALSHPKVAALSIATRPDCIDESVVDLLSECNKIKPTWVELGLQTIHDKTAKYIRRGYELSVYDRSLEMLKAAGLPQIITHVILGLPGESRQMMLDTVRYVAQSHSNGIKLQLLHVIEGTDLCRDFREGGFEVLSLEEYCDIVVECLKILPPDMVVHRLTGDGDKRSLVAPLWSGDKKKVLNTLHKAMERE